MKCFPAALLQGPFAPGGIDQIDCLPTNQPADASDGHSRQTARHAHSSRSSEQKLVVLTAVEREVDCALRRGVRRQRMDRQRGGQNLGANS